jgi:uncharacterized protein involved in cysteine biosynthesis
VSDEPLGAITRPGLLRRAAAGAWQVPAAFAHLLTNPSLWPLALLTAFLVEIFLAGGFLLGAFAGPSLEGALTPGRNLVPPGFEFAIYILAYLGTLGAGMLLGLAAALLLSAPLLDRLSRRVEARLAPRPDREGAAFDAVAALGASLYFLAASLGVLVLGFIPLVGPILAALWGAHTLALRLTEEPLHRRGLGLRAQRAWHREWWAESLGFGLAGLIALVVPVAQLLAGPVLAIGGTLLVLDLETLSPPSAEPGREGSPAVLG